MKHRFDVTDKIVARIIAAHPAILYLKTEDNMEVKLTWLKEYFGIDDEKAVKVLTTFPPMFSLGIPGMEEKVINRRATHAAKPRTKHNCTLLKNVFHRVSSHCDSVSQQVRAGPNGAILLFFSPPKKWKSQLSFAQE